MSDDLTAPGSPATKTRLLDRALSNWKTTVAGTCSFLGGAIGVFTSIYYPASAAPKWVLLISGLAGYITTLLAKDK